MNQNLLIDARRWRNDISAHGAEWEFQNDLHQDLEMHGQLHAWQSVDGGEGIIEVDCNGSNACYYVHADGEGAWAVTVPHPVDGTPVEGFDYVVHLDGRLTLEGVEVDNGITSWRQAERSARNAQTEADLAAI